ncbi:hypothetical protein Bca4012_061445 [Brassica carinata]
MELPDMPRSLARCFVTNARMERNLCSIFPSPVRIKVSVTCSDENGQIYMSREETTNWLGGYVMRFDGTPDLSNCYAQVSDNGAQQGSSSSCSIASGPTQKLKLLFSFFGIETFVVDALLAQPVQPMSSCPKPPPAPVMPPPQVPVKPPPQAIPPPQVKVPPLPPIALVPVFPPPKALTMSPPPATLPPQFKLPPLPPVPPVPFVEPSALAGRRYGNDMTVREALNGRGEAYKTLLREATTALLNSYNSLGFPYNSVAVITYTNMALLGNSQHDVLMTAFRFIKANSGTCKFTVCK